MLCDEHQGSQEERKSILTKMIKEDFMEETELEMGSVVGEIWAG